MAAARCEAPSAQPRDGPEGSNGLLAMADFRPHAAFLASHFASPAASAFGRHEEVSVIIESCATFFIRQRSFTKFRVSGQSCRRVGKTPILHKGGHRVGVPELESNFGIIQFLWILVTVFARLPFFSDIPVCERRSNRELL